ncbi:MAG TPA: T9SS type A sorting domain-containing protein [Chitinophagaceae bacterium]
MKHLLLAFLLLATTFLASGQPGFPDATFNPTDVGNGNGDGPNGTVRTIALQTDGRIFIGGDFTACNGTPLNRIAHLNADGSLARGFNASSTKANGTVHSLALQNDGKVLAGGSFTDYNSNWYHDYVTRLDPDGSLDAYFNNGSGVNGTPGGANGPVYSIVLQGDGKILIGGWFHYYNGTARNYIARLDREGQLDPSFDPGSAVPGGLTTMAMQEDGRILVAGTYTDQSGAIRYYLTRLNSNGSADATFNPGKGVNNAITALAVLPDGKILIGGNFTTFNGTTRNRIARLNKDGGLDNSFNPTTGANGTIQALAVQADGRILIGGDFTSYRGTARNRIARLSGNGNIDATFDPGTGTNQGISALTLAGDGKIFIGGSFTAYDGTSRNRIARLYPDGSLDTSFNRGTGAKGPVLSVSMQADSKLIVAGDFTTYNGMPRNRIARLNSDGILDASFQPGSGADTAILATAIQSDGKILAAGAFRLFNFVAHNRITRLGSDGALDATFNAGSGANGTIYTMVLQNDGRILIGGSFTSYNNTIRFRLARLNSDGTLDASFNPGGGPNGTVATMALLPDGKILIGGSFTEYDGASRNHLARLNSDGTLDASFNPGSGANYPVSTIVWQGDGKILIGGSFTFYNGVARNRIARLNSDGSPDASFNPGSTAAGPVSAIALQRDGRILVGGNGTFSNNLNYTSYGIARLNGDGSLDASFNSPGGGTNHTVSVLALQADGRVLIGGHFTAYNSMGRNRIARLQGGTNELAIGSITLLSCCAGTEFTVPFTATGVYGPENGFTVQLSNASGSFQSPPGPTGIGHLAGTASGSVQARIPFHIPAGSGYRVRVVSSHPYVASPDNGYNLAVYARPQTPFINGPADTFLCAGSNIVLAASATTGMQWYKDSVAISGATGHSFEVSQPGRYSIVSTQNNCASDMSPEVVVTARPLPAKPVILQDGNILTVAASSGIQWYKDGLPIAGATTSRHVAATSGLYSVEVTQNGCTARSAAINVVWTAIVNPATWNGAVTVYPVPVHDVLHFNNTGGRRISVQLLDIGGKQVRTAQFSAASATLSLNGLAPGTYLLLITDVKKGETVASPVVKQ